MGSENGRSAARAVNVQGACLARELNYTDYLQLDKVLNAQVLDLKHVSF